MVKILGIDYGTKSIGLAIGSSGLVKPFKTIKNDVSAIEEIVNAVDEEKIGVMVLGLPLINGEETNASKIVREFGNKLKKELPQNVKFEYVDEQYTSKESLDKAISIGVSQKSRKENHALEACEIIGRYEGR